jgi:hypothetical protein
MVRTQREKRVALRILMIAVLSTVGMAPAQTVQHSRVLVMTGHTGEAPVIRSRGRNYVDLDMLARLLQGSLDYQGSRVVLTLPSPQATTKTREVQAKPADDEKFSRDFVNAAIETLGSMREWASNLAFVIRNGYPVGTMIDEYHGRAMKNFALANSAASTESDRNGLRLLAYEYNSLQSWSDELVEARNAMSAANYSMSQDALLNDSRSQKILGCWSFLGPMFASGRFADDGSCR